MKSTTEVAKELRIIGALGEESVSPELMAGLKKMSLLELDELFVLFSTRKELAQQQSLPCLIRKAREYTSAYAVKHNLRLVEDWQLLESILISHLAHLINEKQEVPS